MAATHRHRLDRRQALVRLVQYEALNIGAEDHFGRGFFSALSGIDSFPSRNSFTALLTARAT